MRPKKTTTALYLFDYHGHELFSKEAIKFNRSFKTRADLIDEIMDGTTTWMLYRVTTNMLHAPMFATAVCTPDGNFLKNRFTGMTGRHPQLPKIISDMFDSHIQA